MSALLEGYAQDRLVLPVCETCWKSHLYPRPRCPHCGKARFQWQEASGQGEVTSFSVVRRAPSPEFAPFAKHRVLTHSIVQQLKRFADEIESQSFGLICALSEE